MGKVPKSGTESQTRKHRYVSFREKVDSIKIDPVRRTRKKIVDYTPDQESFFITAFDHHVEMNITANFTDFVDLCAPLCQSLPQLIYHQKEIMALLQKHIMVKDPNSLEPLLDLVTHFAHDLGPDFEPYFGSTLDMLIDLCSTNQNIDVVQWSFNCLAYLFKYLSRLLTTDLRPTYDAISKLLGKQHQKSFVERFAAESLSFLIRKCTGESLTLIVEHIFKEVLQTRSDEYFQTAILLMTDSMLSTGEALHSRTASILNTILDTCAPHKGDDEPYAAEFVAGITAGVLHHTRAETAKVVYEVAYNYIKTHLDGSKLVYVKLLFVLAGLRKGSRVSDWNELYSNALELLSAVGNQTDLVATKGPLLESSLQLGSAILQNADFKASTAHHHKLLTLAEKLFGKEFFLAFANLAMAENKESFQNFVIPFVKQYVSKHWSYDRQGVALLLLRMSRNGLINRTTDYVPNTLQINSSSEFAIALRDFVLSSVKTADSLEELWFHLELFRRVVVPDKKLLAGLPAFLRKLLGLSPALFHSALVGQVLSLTASIPSTKTKLECLLAVTEHIPSLRESPVFLDGYLELITQLSSAKILDDQLTELFNSFVDGLRSHDHHVRITTFYIMEKLFKLNGSEFPELLALGRLIEQIPLDIANARNITMHTRNLGAKFTTSQLDQFTKSAVPRYLFGLLTARFQPSWESSLEALEKISSVSEVSEAIWELCYAWLENPSQSIVEEPISSAPELAEFASVNCINLESITQKSSEFIFQYQNAAEVVRFDIYDSIKPEPLPPYLRTQAIKVLQKMPAQAEKRSRFLVPHLLWDEDEDIDESSDASTTAWSWKDRVLLLELFAQFGNPKTLYKSAEVYDRYLYLLANRTVSVQKVALKCVLSFRDKQVKKYRDHLNNLLDDTLFKDEITKLVQRSGEEEHSIHDDDKDVVFPLIVRILFGRAQVAKTGGVKQGRRFAVISSLNNVDPKFIRLFVQLATGRLDTTGFLQKHGDEYAVDKSHSTLQEGEKAIRRELGFVTMLEKIIDELRAKAGIAIDVIIEGLLLSLCHSQAFDLDESSPTAVITAKNIKSIRATGMKCLEMLFRVMEVDWFPYFRAIFDEVFAPKLPRFAEENVTQPSSLMKVFVTLSSQAKLVPYFCWEDYAIPKAFYDCVQNDLVKDNVVDMVMSSLQNMLGLELTSDMTDLRNGMLRVCAPKVLSKMPQLFARNSTPQLLEKEANVLVLLLPSFEVSPEVRSQLIDVAMAAMERSTSQVKISVKVTVLQSLITLLSDGRTTKKEVMKVYTSLSRMFKQFTDRHVRQNLATLYDSFGKTVPELARVGHLILELNSFSTKRIDMPDFDRRTAAFASINEKDYETLTAQEWHPLLFNMLFFIKDPEETSLRKLSAYSLRRFIDSYSLQSSEEAAGPYIALQGEVLLPAIRLGLRDSKTEFRHEFISILEHAVRHSKWYSGFVDMKCLLFGGDEEANFFYNVAHIQLHRRQRAIRRLGMLARKRQLTDSSIAHYLLPMIEHYVADVAEGAHNISTEAITTIGVLTRHLTWNQYRAITKRYIAHLNNREERLKTTIKLINTVADALADPDDKGFDGPTEEGEEVEEEEDADGDVEMAVEGAVLLKENLPSQEKLNVFISDDIVPTMQRHLQSTKANDDDDKTLTDRIPLAIPIIKFIKMLTPELVEVKLPSALTKLCQILRAKSQPLRDMIRKTLGRIGRILGAQYLIFIVKELKSALRRGAQLHVLGYSVHSLLSEMKEVLAPGDLDDSCSLIIDIIMEDTFGATGSDKDAEEYTSKMKEVKQHKSFDSAQILASNVTLSTFSAIIQPVKAILLYEKLSLTIERKIEELLRRVAQGMYHNVEAGQESVLVMCHELYKMCQNVEEKEQKKHERAKQETSRDLIKREQEQHFLVTLDSRHWGEKDVIYVKNLYLLIRFIVDALRTVFGRYENLLQVKYVMGFMPMLEESLQSSYESVQISTVRLLTLVIKLPLPDMTEKMKTFGRQTLGLVKSCPSTNAELCQAGLKFLSTMLRQKDSFTMKDGAIAYILERIRPDLEEPDRQGVTFTFIKSVLSKKIILSEVYDIMDKIAEVMVTNHSKMIRDTCRSAYFQFLTDYPQGKGRLTKQLKFLVNNLQYPSPAGRLSVMEVMHLLLTKVNSEQIQEVTASFFVALVQVLANDDDSRCKENAATVIRELFQIAGGEQLGYMEKLILAWLSDSDNAPLLRCGLQVAGLYLSEVDKKQQNKKLMGLAEKQVLAVLDAGRADSAGTTTWEAMYFALQFVVKVAQAAPQVVFGSAYQQMWDLVENSLLYPHPWVRLVAARLEGKLFSEMKNDYCEITIDPLQSTAFKFVRQLGAVGIAEELGIQIVKNLIFISRRWEQEGAMYVPLKQSKDESGGEDEENGDENDNGEENGRAETEDLTALGWLVKKVASVLRNEKAKVAETAVSKKASIQYLATVIQIVTPERLNDLSQDLVLAFYPFSESEDSRFKDYKDLCIEALSMIEEKMGTTEYLNVYNTVRQIIADKRTQRRTKRAVEAVRNPQLHAKKKMKKNIVKREKRKQVRDENGYYHTKKRRT
ncbi:U3 small nucleolar RNA-associated protein 20 [Trichomonascus vanleenenianus]|uniref:Utp20p n=1 Tax=Trichomonascus vanleenenianus TaxID=2268995 RepID=UPI003EC9A4A7